MGKNKKKPSSPKAASAPIEKEEARNGVDNVTAVEDTIAEEANGIDVKQQAMNATEATKEEEKEDTKEISTNGSVNIEEIIKERDEFKASYDNLLSKLSSMKSVFSKMKESQNEVEIYKEKLETSERENETLLATNKLIEGEKINLLNEKKQLSEESASLNNECERLSKQLTSIRREYQQKEESLSDEKYQLENVNSRLNKRISDLKIEVQELKLVYDEVGVEMAQKVADSEEIQTLLSQEKQENARKQAEIDQLNQKIGELNSKNQELIKSGKENDLKFEQDKNKILDENNGNLTKLKTYEDEIVRLKESLNQIPEYENDIKNKQLLIGKLRHEAVILNEHLTKSLTMLKQQLGSPNNTIDKELISNVVVSFLQFPRGDPKKFEALQLISALLGWDESKKVAAGLLHQQVQSNSEGDDKGGRQSFVNLWTDFLERESSGGANK